MLNFGYKIYTFKGKTKKMDIKVSKKEKLIKFLIHNVQGMSFGSAQKEMRLGKIKLNGKRVKDNVDVNVGDVVEIHEIKKSIPTVSVLHRDDNILIVNKPAGIECATRDKSSDNTYSLEEIFEKENAIVVHRLDRMTEGLVILAKTKDVAKKFEEYFRLRKIDKFYKTAVSKVPPKDHEILTAYLKKDSKNALVQISDKASDGYKEIVTEYWVEKAYEKCTLLNIQLHTGRTHQIRAHLAHMGFGVMGDEKYNKNSPTLSNVYKGYFLSAYKLKFHLDGDMEYLNNIDISITPSWLKYVE